MSGFSNSLSHFYGIRAIRIRYSIHTFSNFTKVSRFVSSLDLSVSEYETYNICNFATTYDGQTAEKVSPSTATALPPPSNLQWTQIRDFQTRTRTRNPGLTFSKPENPGLQKEPGFGNSKSKIARCVHQAVKRRIDTFWHNQNVWFSFTN